MLENMSSNFLFEIQLTAHIDSQSMVVISKHYVD